ncbi:MAG: beta-lactamase family protein [Psychrosphaera sp.]|nr:beta-lactamase family protein [Psychrosphaera sp.]
MNFILENFTAAELVFIGLLIEAALAIFLFSVLVRVAARLKIISKERRDRVIEKKKGKKWIGGIYAVLGLIIIIGMGFGMHWQSADEPKVWQQGDIGSVTASINQLSLDFLVNKDIRDLCVGIIKGNQTHSACFTHAQAKAAIAIDNSAIFEIGSITKTFTYATMHKVLNKHQIALDDKIAPYLPKDLTDKHPAIANITFKQLATHSSGLSKQPSGWNWTTVASIFSANVLGNPYENLDKNFVFEYLETAELAPNEAEYSNIGVGLLGLILSELEGQSYSQMIQDNVFSPLNMQASTAGYPTNKDKIVAGFGQFRTIGSVVLTAESDRWTFTDVLAGAGAINSNLSDMMKFLGHSMASYQQPMYKDENNLVPIGENGQINLGWLMMPLNDEKTENVVFHNGATGGFRSFMGFDESSNTGVVILSNSTRYVDALGKDILSALLADEAVTALAGDLR